MLITKLTETNYRIEITPEELTHYQVIVSQSERLHICNVTSLLSYVLTYAEQHWYDTVIEPPSLSINKDILGNPDLDNAGNSKN